VCERERRGERDGESQFAHVCVCIFELSTMCSMYDSDDEVDSSIVSLS
jgi:hypothetical protein